MIYAYRELAKLIDSKTDPERLGYVQHDRDEMEVLFSRCCRTLIEQKACAITQTWCSQSGIGSSKIR